MKNSNSVRIEGELFWSKWMNNFNTKFNPDNTKYECTIGNISTTDVKKLESLGIKIKHKDTMGSYIVAKSQYLFKPLAEDGSEVNLDEVGNGTKVVADLSSYEHRMTPKHGMAPSIKKLVVTNVVTYEPEAITDDVL